MQKGVLAALLLAAPLPAAAAGYYVPDTGTTARSRGGAFVARADDPLAIVYNPGALADQRKIQFLFDVTVLRQSQTFERDGVPSDGESGTVAKNDPPPQVVPAIVYTQPLGDRWTLAAGLVAPAGPRWKFEKDGPQRFTNTELFLTEATYGLALAVKAHPKVSIGMYAGALIAGVEQDFVLTANSAAPPAERPENDIRAHMEVQDPFTLTAGVGVKAYPMENVELGFSYRPEANIDAGGTLVTEGAFEAKDDVHFQFTLPAIWRGAIRWVRPTWNVEMDVVWEGWGSHEEEVLVADDGNFAGASKGVAPRAFRDSWGVRAGGSWQVVEVAELHGGAYFETGSVPTRTMDVGTYDPNKVGVAFGLTVDLTKTLAVSMNATKTFLQTVKVEDSIQRQQSPFAESVVPREAKSVIGNGTYSGSYEMAGIAFLARF